jgi:putative heme-binding domain-containing protein
MCIRFTFSLASCLMLILAVPVHAQDRSSEEKTFWIWDGEKPAAHLRREFVAADDLKKATLIASGDDKAQLYVNGKRVAQGDGWQSPQVVDVTSLLMKGEKNVIAARAENAGGVAGFLAQLVMEGASGKTVLGSDGSWQAMTPPRKGWMEVGFQPKPKEAVPATVLNALGTDPRGAVNAALLASLSSLKEPEATPVDRIKVPEGFQVELLYSVPKTQQGSWVAMTHDDKGRLIVSDQYGALYRFSPPAAGEVLSQGDVEKIEVDIGGAHGLLYAFDALYVSINTGEHGGRGLYKITDSDGDDRFDKKQLLKKFQEQGGEHGPHAVLLGPEGKSIYVVCGNQTALPEYDHSRVPPVWGEDLLLPRIYGKGFMKGTMAPRGWIAKTDPDGKEWTIVATGFRNEYDAAFDKNGELFTYDADMEWDMNTPWYRPTRINHVISGAEFGWRNGSGKWPEYFSDSFGAVVDVGPGSPTGVCFGTGVKFPARYQNAFYAADWSYGKLYAIHMTPQGASYTGEVEEFMSAQPLPLTDLLVHPDDGALYVAIGGRRVQSGLYRVAYVGSESTDPAAVVAGGEEARKQRRMLEEYHAKQDPAAVEMAWPFLGSEDRALRYAARVAIEHQPVAEWQEPALGEDDPKSALAALIALARHGDMDVQARVVAKLAGFDVAELKRQQQLDLIRAWGLTFIRLGEPNEAQKKMVTTQWAAEFPSKLPRVNAQLSELMVYLQAPRAAEVIVDLLESAPSQEGQLTFGKNLRLLTAGWTEELRRRYFEWLLRAQSFKGGPSLQFFVQSIKKDAVANLPDDHKAGLQELIDAVPKSDAPQFTITPREFQKNWTMADFEPLLSVGLEGGRDFANGRNMFGAATCFACHRFNQEGGAIGPDLSSVAGKFSPRDLLESIIDPNKEISDQYGQMVFHKIDGTQVVGRIMNLSGDSVRINTNMLNPDEIVSVDRKLIKKMEPSPHSMMPPGLLNTLNEDDVLDLLAYLLSKGDADDPLFEH